MMETKGTIRLTYQAPKSSNGAVANAAEIPTDLRDYVLTELASYADDIPEDVAERIIRRVASRLRSAFRASQKVL